MPLAVPEEAGVYRQSGNVSKFVKDNTLSSLSHRYKKDAVIFGPVG